MDGIVDNVEHERGQQEKRMPNIELGGVKILSPLVLQCLIGLNEEGWSPYIDYDMTEASRYAINQNFYTV